MRLTSTGRIVLFRRFPPAPKPSNRGCSFPNKRLCARTIAPPPPPMLAPAPAPSCSLSLASFAPTARTCRANASRAQRLIANTAIHRRAAAFCSAPFFSAMSAAEILLDLLDLLDFEAFASSTIVLGSRRTMRRDWMRSRRCSALVLPKRCMRAFVGFCPPSLAFWEAFSSKSRDNSASASTQCLIIVGSDTMQSRCSTSSASHSRKMLSNVTASSM